MINPSMMVDMAMLALTQGNLFLLKDIFCYKTTCRRAICVKNVKYIYFMETVREYCLFHSITLVT